MNIFVYGTLRPGQVNASLVADLRPDARPARLGGFTLLAGCGYPYAVAAAGGEVLGIVYGFAEADAILALRRLDRLEGYRPDDPERSHYLRIERRVDFTDHIGGASSTFVYVAGPRVDVTGLERLGNDWTRRTTCRRLSGSHRERRM